MAAKKKIYAVKCGRSPGIYYSWEEANENVYKYKGAVVRAFKDIESAEAYYYNKRISKEIVPKNKSKPKTAKEIKEITAYIDGSFNNYTHEYGAGVVILKDGAILNVYSQKGKNKNFQQYCNVAGELLAAMMAVQYCKLHGYNRLILCHDFNGVETIVNNPKKQNELSERYKQFMIKNKKSVDIVFRKVQAHSGDKFNNLADELSRCACDIPAIDIPAVI